MVAGDPPDLMVTGRSDDGVVMGLSHRQWVLHGLQFHPERFLTEHGFALVENFLALGPLAGRLVRIPFATAPAVAAPWETAHARSR
jgi:GMP synthase-like glutamine amidotransferase